MKSMYWLGGVFVVLGILSGVIGVVSYRNGQRQLASYVRTTATVSDWVPDPNYGTPDYCPKYEYTTQDGSTRSYIGSDCEARPDPQTVGTGRRSSSMTPPIPTPTWQPGVGPAARARLSSREPSGSASSCCLD